MNKFYTINKLPDHYFGCTCTIFCFVVLNEEPIALNVGTSAFDMVTIMDLDKLNDEASYNRFVDFLKSIAVKSGCSALPVKYDIEYAKSKYDVIMKTVTDVH